MRVVAGEKRKRDDMVEKERVKEREKIMGNCWRNYLAGVPEEEECMMSVNGTGYQDEETWIEWLRNFILWKRKRVKTEKPVVLLLDGHFSHLSIESLFLATKNQIVVLCLPSHTTSILQPNDCSANKQFKANLNKELEEQVALDLLVENCNITLFMLYGLKNENMSHTISISWKQTGLFPLDSLKSVGEVKKYQVKQQKQKEQKRLDELADIVLERGNKKKKFEEEKEKQKVESGKIVFGTKQVRCLSSPECLA